MQTKLHKLRFPAVVCALAVLFCTLLSQPYTSMSVCDDGPYILMARTLADTGHIVYNSWAAAMIVFQLYVAALAIHLFGYSFTVVRMSNLFIAMVAAFAIQRTLTRASISERNATFATLALVLSPLYLMLAPTFMSDIDGLFAIVLCLYGCLRALHAGSDRAAIGWICFAVTTNAICGTSRQIAWLGGLVMVPSALYLFRHRRSVLLAGTAATAAGAVFILAGMQWLKHQPYVVPVPLRLAGVPIVHAMKQLGLLLLDIPFLLLPVFLVFVPELRKHRSLKLASALLLLLAVLLFLFTYPAVPDGRLEALLEPTAGNNTFGSWVTVLGLFDIFTIKGHAPRFLSPAAQVAFSIASYGGLIAFCVCAAQSHRKPLVVASPRTSWRQLLILCVPFSVAYLFLLMSATATTYFIYDRYVLGFLFLALLCLVRFYQDRIRNSLPLYTLGIIVCMAVYGVAVTHNYFALDRARVFMADQLRAKGVPATAVDGGWDFNFDTELQYASHLNHPTVLFPADAYVRPSPLAPGTCEMFSAEKSPHVRPLYDISFDPSACYGPAPFAPVQYSRWPYRSGTLYVVYALPPGTPQTANLVGR